MKSEFEVLENEFVKYPEKADELWSWNNERESEASEQGGKVTGKSAFAVFFEKSNLMDGRNNYTVIN